MAKRTTDTVTPVKFPAISVPVKVKVLSPPVSVPVYDQTDVPESVVLLVCIVFIHPVSNRLPVKSREESVVEVLFCGVETVTIGGTVSIVRMLETQAPVLPTLFCESTPSLYMPSPRVGACQPVAVTLPEYTFPLAVQTPLPHASRYTVYPLMIPALLGGFHI